MDVLFIEIEAKMFCLFIMVFLGSFQTKSPQPQWSKLRYVFLFSIVGSILSIMQGVAEAFYEEPYAYNLFSVAFGLCCALSVYFGGNYACGIKKVTLTLHKQVVLSAGALVFGCLAYFSSKCRVGTALYILTFAIIIAFVVSQYNKIKIDNLTKLYNRYGIDEEIRRQLHQYEHDKNNSFYIIACDIDNFKYINDSWGHQEGDRALVLIATALLKAGQKFDAEVFRIGGDEFVIITDTSEEGLATAVIDAIKCELDNVDFRDDFDIKMSMGVALYDGIVPFDELLNNADKKLYQSKRNSKNSDFQRTIY